MRNVCAGTNRHQSATNLQMASLQSHHPQGLASSSRRKEQQRVAFRSCASSVSQQRGAIPTGGVIALPISTTLAPANRRIGRPSIGRSAVVAEASSQVYDSIIVGAGISGLTTAQTLKAKHGISNFLVTEARERVGGNITSMQGDGFIWEEGPNSFQPNDYILQVAVRLWWCRERESRAVEGPCAR